jgi:integrase
LTNDELRAVVSSSEGDLQILFFLGYYTALRLGDCVTLKWTEIDFPKRMITRVPNKTKARGKAKAVQAYMDDPLFAALKAHGKAVKGTYVFPNLNRMYTTDGMRQEISKGIQKHFRACGIETVAETEGPRQRAACEVGFHSLRHTFITHQAEAGVNPQMIAAQVGHSSLDTTAIYVHQSGETAKRLAGNLPSLTGEELITVYDLPTEVVGLIESMNAKNWKQIRERILEAAS